MSQSAVCAWKGVGDDLELKTGAMLVGPSRMMMITLLCFGYKL